MLISFTLKASHLTSSTETGCQHVVHILRYIGGEIIKKRSLHADWNLWTDHESSLQQSSLYKGKNFINFISSPRNVLSRSILSHELMASCFIHLKMPRRHELILSIIKLSTLLSPRQKYLTDSSKPAFNNILLSKKNFQWSFHSSAKYSNRPMIKWYDLGIKPDFVVW